MRNPKESRANWYPTAEGRFWPKVNKSGPLSPTRPDLGECWVWMGAKFENGYGAFRFFRGGTGRAHRYAYMLLVGDIPGDLVVDHLCKRVDCVNPRHMEVVTDVENVMRGDSPHAENARKDTCPSGHEFDRLKGDGRRQCTKCSRQYQADYYQRNKQRIARRDRERKLRQSQDHHLVH